VAVGAVVLPPTGTRERAVPLFFHVLPPSIMFGEFPGSNVCLFVVSGDVTLY